MDKREDILSDTELWKNFLEGDDRCISIVYKRYVNDLFSYGLKIVNDESLVKDCIQDVFINLIDSRRKLLIGARIHIYLFKSLRNRLLDEIRSVSRKHKILDSKNISKESTVSDSAEGEMIWKEERLLVQEEIRKAVNSLTGKQKEIIYLKYTKGLSYDEIALLLEIDKASARTLLYRTLKTIKEKLKQKALILIAFIHSW